MQPEAEEETADKEDDWEWGDDDAVIVPFCDLENPLTCESCQ